MFEYKLLKNVDLPSISTPLNFNYAFIKISFLARLSILIKTIVFNI